MAGTLPDLRIPLRVRLTRPKLQTLSHVPAMHLADDDSTCLQDYLTEEELEQLQLEQEQEDYIRSIPTPEERNPSLK